MEPAFPGGWRSDLDSVESIQSVCDTFDSSLMMAADGTENPWTWQQLLTWIATENQRSQGSCQGHSITTTCEASIRRSTGLVVPLNRQYAYIESQKKDGIRSDSGSSITSGVKVAKEGLPLESLWPYSGRYDRNIPQACYDNRPYRLLKATYCENPDQLKTAGKSGLPIHIGMQWRRSFSSGQGIITDYGGGGGGGHAVAWFYTDQKGPDGDNLWAILNSHGNRWGQHGARLFTDRVIDQVLNSIRFGAIGIGEMEMPVETQGKATI